MNKWMNKKEVQGTEELWKKDTESRLEGEAWGQKVLGGIWGKHLTDDQAWAEPSKMAGRQGVREEEGTAGVGWGVPGTGRSMCTDAKLWKSKCTGKAAGSLVWWEHRVRLGVTEALNIKLILLIISEIIVFIKLKLINFILEVILKFDKHQP